ncbi:hypothetical protein P692DRAFT_201742775 [Suillus brevipes Sb2]|nr:hypothetical protein P692DRAFT_201742775 [Suillus brevipes Sb2]
MVLAGLALSSDDTLLVTACYETIKLWAFESRHLLASFDILPPHSLTLSPDLRQLAYASGSDIYIYNTPAEILASIGPAQDAQFPATSALPPNHSHLAQATNLETSPPPRRLGGLRQSLRQHLSFRSRPSHEPPEIEVAAGRKFTRLAVVKLPEYKKVDDTRHPSRQQPPASSAMAANDPPSESSDLDSLPDVHWCMAFLCYNSCWSHGRLRMPPRWRLERVYPLQQAGTTSGSRGGSHGRS